MAQLSSALRATHPAEGSTRGLFSLAARGKFSIAPGYLRLSRRRIASPSVFLRVQAPLGALSSQAIGDLLYKACRRAQLPRIGAHRLRHTAATHMLRRGASLSEIAQVLRHRSLLTTAIYAKVDRTALRLLAQPWPGDCR